MANLSSPDGAWFLYLIECDDGRLYTGITNDLAARFEKHAKGKGAAFTRMNKPVRFVAARRYDSLSLAAKAEALLKKQERSFKLTWAVANPPPSHVADAVSAGGGADPATDRTTE